MSIATEDIAKIEDIVQRIVDERLKLQAATYSPYEIELRERMLRVEEELKHQRELMIEGFKQMDKRFEQVDKRFEQVDKRFEQVDKRFDQVHQEIMAIHNEIKLLMRWGFGALIAVGGLFAAVLRLIV